MPSQFPHGHGEGVDLAGGVDPLGAGEQAFDGDDLVREFAAVAEPL